MMEKRQYRYTFVHKCSSVFMMLTLVWLTLSIPFVYAAQQLQKEKTQHGKVSSNNTTNPFASTTEEKTQTGANTLAEYLHPPTALPDKHSTTLVNYYKGYPSDIYLAYHPERLSPPPELFL